MEIFILVVSVVALLVSAVTLWVVLNVGEKVYHISNFIYQNGLRMCYRDSEDLRERFSARKPTRSSAEV